MAMPVNKDDEFDLKLAVTCADAFAEASGLGCTVSDCDGKVLHQTGLSYARCQLCKLLGKSCESCTQAHLYGMNEAERFGGKYIYFCPLGLTFFASPILGSEGSAAQITAGPFLMVERDDYTIFDLVERQGLSGELLKSAVSAVENIPYAEASRVNSLSTLLFMAVGFMNNVSQENRMLEIQDSDAVQGQISAYIMELKTAENKQAYPLETERNLLEAIKQTNREEAAKLLNELLGYIFFSYGGELSIIKSRVFELLVLMSRAAIEGGADTETTLNASHGYLQKIGGMSNMDELCAWLAGVMNRFIDSVFSYAEVKHLDVIHKAMQYIRKNYTDKVTLDDTAWEVGLSPSYFSRVFKEETGSSFNSYLNKLRVEKSKTLLVTTELRLIDIAVAVGFEDQSYYTKVFKKQTGVSPNKFREKKGRITRISDKTEEIH